MSRCRVVIIGAGAAGLSAGVKLQQLGVEDVIILEAAEDRVGGRVWSRAVREGGARVEEGAQWIHGDDGNVVHQIAQQLGFLSDNNDCVSPSDAIFIKNGEVVPNELILPIIMAVTNVENSLKHADDETVESFNNVDEYFRDGLHKEQDRLLNKILTRVMRLVARVRGKNHEVTGLEESFYHWFSQFQCSNNGSPSMVETSVHQNKVYQECPGSQTVNIARDHCYQELLEKYAETVIDKVEFSKTVIRVETEDEMIRVRCDDGSEVTADVCIVTLPLGVLKHSHQSLFTPALPTWKQEAIKNMGFGTNAKIYLCFDVDISEVAPDLKPAGFNFLRDNPGDDDDWVGGVFSMLPNNTDPRVLVTWLSGTHAATVESLSEDEVLRGVNRLIDTFIKPILPSFPYPVSCHVTKWSTSSLSRGSYSYLTPTTPPATPELLSRPVGRLLFAGEATHPRFFSTVHAALESGWREAERANNILKTK